MRKLTIPKLTLLQWLGYLGLIPFVLMPLLGAFGLMEPGRALRAFQLYSALILGFMAGVLWPGWTAITGRLSGITLAAHQHRGIDAFAVLTGVNTPRHPQSVDI